MARRFTKFTIKVSILAGVIYATADQGLWKDTDNADEVYSNLYKSVDPYLKEVPVELPKIPSTSCIAKATRDYYNKGVIATVNFIAQLPGQVSEWTSQGSNYLYETISSSAAVEQETEKKQ